MDSAQLNWLTNFIWNIADDVLRDVYVRGKYRDVILPMTVLRRLDAVLESTKQEVLDMKAALDKEGITNQDAALKKLGLKLSASDLKLIVNAVSWRDEAAPPVIKKVHKKGVTADPLRGLYEAKVAGKSALVEYEPDSELRDFEQIPFLEAPPSGLPGGLPSEATAKEGIEAFIRREVLPYTPDAWIVEGDTKIGYEVSFTRHFYQPPQLRTLAEISADILKLEQETEGLLTEITKGAAK